MGEFELELEKKKSKERHSISLFEYEETLLQQAYKKFNNHRKLNCFIGMLVSIGLDKCLSDVDFELLFGVSRDRNASRYLGKLEQTKVQKAYEELTATFIESLTAFERNLTDGNAPHYDTKIIQFPQRMIQFSGSA